jgi:protein phosphatase
MKLKIGARTDSGRVRTNNEDSLYIDGQRDLFIVADGMGGHKSGEVASRIAIDIIPEVLSKELSEIEEAKEIIQEAISKANKAIYDRSQFSPGKKGMGTTLVLALIIKEHILVAHAGDSRAYLIRAGEIIESTEDHSKVSEMVRIGQLTREQARDHFMKHVVTKSLGAENEIEPEIACWNWEEKSFLLLCSDGLTDMLRDDEILKIINSDEDPQGVCDQLVKAANEKGGKDNITTILVC